MVCNIVKNFFNEESTVLNFFKVFPFDFYRHKHEIDKIIRFLCKGTFISKNKLSEFGAIK